MKRLLATLYWNILLQIRNGYYAVTIIFVLVMVALLSLLPAEVRLDLLLPGLIALNLVLGYFFIAFLVMLEKDERTLTAVIVTPLRSSEYLVSKVLSLVLICVLENVLLVTLSYGIHVQFILLLTGMIALSALYILVGFVVVTRFHSINEYLLPGGAIVPLLFIPLIDHAGLWHSPLFYLHPVQPMLLLMRGAFLPVTTWEIIYGVSGSFFWGGLSFVWALRTFDHFVVQRMDIQEKVA